MGPAKNPAPTQAHLAHVWAERKCIYVTFLDGQLQFCAELSPVGNLALIFKGRFLLGVILATESEMNLGSFFCLSGHQGRKDTGNRRQSDRGENGDVERERRGFNLLKSYIPSMTCSAIAPG